MLFEEESDDRQHQQQPGGRDPSEGRQITTKVISPTGELAAAGALSAPRDEPTSGAKSGGYFDSISSYFGGRGSHSAAKVGKDLMGADAGTPMGGLRNKPPPAPPATLTPATTASAASDRGGEARAPPPAVRTCSGDTSLTRADTLEQGAAVAKPDANGRLRKFLARGLLRSIDRFGCYIEVGVGPHFASHLAWGSGDSGREANRANRSLNRALMSDVEDVQFCVRKPRQSTARASKK